MKAQPNPSIVMPKDSKDLDEQQKNSEEISANQDAEFFVVGIGASAGGLQALEEFFAHMRCDSGAAFVVIQHLSPDFKSLMKELLERRTNMKVNKVIDGMPLEPNQVYLIPPRNNLTVKERHLYLSTHSPSSKFQLHYPINLFFESLAKDCRQYSVGIVLSGTGSDGSLGLQAIAENAGVTLAQSPSTAEFDGMPQCAIATGIVDRVLAPQQLAETVYEITTQKKTTIAEENLLNPELSERDLNTIIDLLDKYDQLDFSYYKPSTLARRVHRRSALSGYQNITDYIKYLSVTPKEQDLLKNDLLIGVTQFFRDRPAWDILEHEILPKLLLGIPEEQQFRVWVSACSTGEEAYSMAMLLEHLREKLGRKIDIKIFATDLDNQALARASEGKYSSNIVASVPEDYLERYFQWRSGCYYISRPIREMIIFAPHNLAKHAGFLQMNLVSCRNVLIYMRPQIQKQVIRMLHFSLQNQGVLFLGESENPGDIQDEFIVLHTKWKIYQKRRDVRLSSASFPPNKFNYALPPKSYQEKSFRSYENNQTQQIVDILALALRNVYQHQGATCFLINMEEKLLHSVVDKLDLLRIPTGVLQSQTATAMLPEELRIPLSTAVNRCRRSSTPVTYSDIKIQRVEGEILSVSLTVIYNEGNSDATSSFTVAIAPMPSEYENPENTTDNPTDIGASFELNKDTHERILSLEHEVQQTRENLQSAIEELETTNEEQQSTNEELHASNEELQSTNEELHSVNEELYTVNSEYQSKIAELTELGRDMDNLLKSIAIGVVFLDVNLRVRKFTTAATVAINLLDSDIARPISHITHNLDCDNFFDLLEQILETQQPHEQEIKLRLSRDNQSLFMRLDPYLTEMGLCEGIVMSFVDITELKRTQRQLEDTFALLQALYDSSPVGFALYDEDFRCQRINPVLAAINGYTVEEHLGRSLPELIPDLFPQVEPILRQVLKSGQSFANIEMSGTTAADPGKIHDWLANYYPIVLENGKRGVGVTISDITEIKQAQQAVQQSKARLQYLLSTASTVIFSCEAHANFACTFVSDNLLAMTGHATAAFLSQTSFWFNYIHPADRGLVRRKLEDLLTGEYGKHEYRLAKSGGGYLWVQTSLQLIRNRQGEPQEIIGAFVDISDRKEAEEALQRNESLFRLTLDQSRITVFTQDLDLRYTWIYNPEFSSETSLVGKSDFEILPESIKTELIELKRRVMEQRESITSYQVAMPVNGEERYFDLKLEPLMDKDDGVVGIAGVSYDITKEREQQSLLEEKNAALAKASIDAEAASVAKGEFLANMSHEIRTPMTAILGFTDLLAERVQEDEISAAHIATIQASGKTLLALINDILDLSKIEAGKLIIKYETVVLRDLFQNVRAIFTPHCQSKDLELAITVEDSVPEVIIFDGIRLNQILFNMVSNAIKFTEPGGQITLIARAQKSSAKRITLSIDISDDGIGISQEDQQLIFGAFVQSEGQSTRKYGGTGLGLNITQRLTKMLNGDISLESELGEGSTFHFAFREVRYGDAKSVAASPQHLESSLTLDDFPKLKILVVDDAPTNRMLMKHLFRKTKHETIEAENGEVAIAMAEEHQPDVILLDLLMPVLDGRETVKRLRSKPITAEIPILLFTATIGTIPEDIVDRINGVLSKPINKTELITQLRKIFWYG